MNQIKKYVTKNRITLTLDEQNEAYIKGDYNTLTKSVLPLIYGIALKYANCSKKSVDDLFSVGLSILPETYKTFDVSRANIVTYVARRVRWIILDEFKKQDVETSNIDDHCDIELTEQTYEDPNITDILNDTLIGKDYDIITRYYGIGCEPETMTAIAETYGVSKQTVSECVAKIKRNLRKCKKLEIILEEIKTFDN